MIAKADTAQRLAQLPTMPFSVVWSQGHAYVLEGHGRPRWVGLDSRRRPQALTSDDMRRRGWSHRPAR
ncbi:hypothetical protein EV193_11885 [Herbihabitans rhizosphaerae]|uniref:Uncharacterized protein n=1 Tax=Herbihabitans rhizosphaerae TaxID=1872711 RepID=A0A4Q7KDY5_9PSEU|nr:hypothetical protein EV193_11885 [Herbihabitans rhizosphaerae]